MKLYFGPTSPFSRKVRIVIYELGLSDQVHEIEIDLWNNKDLIQINPINKVPTLLLSSKEPLFESSLICEYLYSIRPNKSMYPSERVAYFKTLRVQALADGAIERAARLYMEGQKREHEQDQRMVERCIEVRESSLDWLEKNFDDFESQSTIGAISVACYLSYLDFRFEDFEWKKPHPRLWNWFTYFSELKSMRQTQYHVFDA